ncbi:hypothetical protein KFU94_62620 [Chloroflexi bacterium TSY]|nr:hypothetical protein [Chloroflexi bacterium TSY]
MTATAKKVLPLPGVGIVGRGVNLRPRFPYQLKDVLDQLIQTEHKENVREVYSKETDQTYLLPYGCEINESPPMPASQALNQSIIEETWERFESNLTLDASLAAGNGIFSIDATAGNASHLQHSDEAYYALRSSFIPLWSVYLHSLKPITDKDLDDLVVKCLHSLEPITHEDLAALNIKYLHSIKPITDEDLDDLNAKDLYNLKPITDEDLDDLNFRRIEFEHDYRKHYEAFFDRFGTHYIKRVWVGGKATVALSIAKSSQMTKEEIQAGIQASYGLGAKTDEKNHREKLRNNSECTVFGKGGDELYLAALSSLDKEHYNEWLATIKKNPQVIELEVAGIWTLIENNFLAKALQDAYIAATTFTPIAAIFNIDSEIYFVRGDTYCCYHASKGRTLKPKRMTHKWPTLPTGFRSPDAAFVGYDYFEQSAFHEETPQKKLFFFHKDQYLRIDLKTNEIDEGYPKAIQEGWPDFLFDRLDAVIVDDPKSLYFFNGHYYAQYDLRERCIDEEYPELISKRWAGITFDRIDAAMVWGHNKAYFFRGDQHIRYDLVTFNTDPGYPKSIIGSYVEDWKFF